MIALLALCALPAFGHIPHHTIDALAIPADLSPSETWYAVHTPYGVSNLMAGQGGAHTGWEAMGGEPMADVIIDGALLDDGTLVLLSDEHLWWSGDGASWQSGPPPVGATTLLGGAELWVAGSHGVWRGMPDQGLEPSLPDVDVIHLSQGPAGLLAIAVGGASLSLFDGTDWSELEGPGSELLSGVYDTDATYVGDIAGDVWRHDGGAWSACGELPEDDSGQEWYPHVTHMAADGSRVLAVPAWKGPFASDDDCATWQDRASPLAVQFSQTDISSSFTTMQADGDRWAIAGWDSVGVSDDAGATWTQAYIMPPDITRGLEHSPSYATDGYVYVGANGAGIMRTSDGYHFESLAGGTKYPNIQQVLFPAWATDDQDLYSIINHVFWRSLDGGLSWFEQENPHSYVFALATLQDPDRIWVFGRSTGGAESTQLSQSLDDGETWSNIPALDLALAGSTPAYATTTGAGEVCLSASNPITVVCSSEAQTAWVASYSAESERITPIFAWPPEAPVRVVFADGLGVHISDDDGQSWTTAQAMTDDTVYTMTMADDGTLFIATTAANLLRSTDGGASWDDTGLRFPAQVFVLDARPSFDVTAELLVGSHDGTYLVTDALDAAPVSERWGAYNLVDNSSTYIHWHDEPSKVACGNCVMSQIQPFDPGTEAYLGLRGDVVRVIGTADGASEVRLEIDGATAALLGDVAASAPTVLAEVSGLGPGYHHVVLTGMTGSGFSLDCFEGGAGALVIAAGPDDTGPFDTQDETDTPDDTEPLDDTGPSVDTGDTGDDNFRDCFCGTGGLAGGSLWLLGGLGVALRRRRSGALGALAGR